MKVTWKSDTTGEFPPRHCKGGGGADVVLGPLRSPWSSLALSNPGKYNEEQKAWRRTPPGKTTSWQPSKLKKYALSTWNSPTWSEWQNASPYPLSNFPIAWRTVNGLMAPP